MGDDGLVKLVQIEYKKKINKKKRIPPCDQRLTALREKALELPKERSQVPSLLPSPLHTPTHTPFAGWGDNNGCRRSRDGRLWTLTALCYVMNVWSPPGPNPPSPLNVTPIWCYGLPMCSMWTEHTWSGLNRGHTHKNNTHLLLLFIHVQLASFG